MPQYAEQESKTFRTREEAEAWAKKRKARLKAGELGSAKIDIDFEEDRGLWQARILIPV